MFLVLVDKYFLAAKIWSFAIFSKKTGFFLLKIGRIQSRKRGLKTLRAGIAIAARGNAQRRTRGLPSPQAAF
jgi:hypothetical protein